MAMPVAIRRLVRHLRTTRLHRIPAASISSLPTGRLPQVREIHNGPKIVRDLAHRWMLTSLSSMSTVICDEMNGQASARYFSVIDEPHEFELQGSCSTCLKLVVELACDARALFLSRQLQSQCNGREAP